MFQYAMGRALSLKYNKKLYLDTSSYKYDSKRKYELGNYKIKYSENGNFLIARVLKILQGINKEIAIKRVVNKSCGYGKEIEEYIYQDNVDKTYLDGYWQNVLYFDNIHNELKEEFQYNGILSELQKELIFKMKKENSVAVHVRRGDYLDNQGIYHILGEEYYNLAIENMKKNVNENIIFYIFSDDIEWCKRTFYDVKNIVFIDEKISENHYSDFELMRNCQNFIIANSTFSWWASWLCENQNKLIIGPKKWFKDEEKNEKNRVALLDKVVLL